MTKGEAIYVRNLLEEIDAIEEFKEEIIRSYNNKVESAYYAGTLPEYICDELVGVLDKHLKNAEDELASISFSKPEGRRNNER
jgi:hypothetical protein